MVTLVTTLSGESSNSYADVAYCDTYWADHYSSTKAAAWAALTSAQKASALFHACRSLEALRFTSQYPRLLEPTPIDYNSKTGLVDYVQIEGEAVKADLNQALQFPRNVDVTTLGVYYIPPAILSAQCEQALYLTTFDEDAAAASIKGLDFESVTVGQVSTTQRFTGSTSSNAATLRLSPIAVELVSPYLIRNGKLRRA